MRPFRAMTVATLVVGGWIGWRAGVISGELGAPAPETAAVSPYVAGAQAWWLADGLARAEAAAPSSASAEPSQPAPQYAYAGAPELVRDEGVAWSRRPAPGSAEAGQDGPLGGGAPWFGAPSARFDDEAGAFERAEDDGASVFRASMGSGGQPVDLSPPVADPATKAQAFAAAERGYARLRDGDRRAAAASFRLATSLDPDHPNAVAWRRERRRLERQFSTEFYSIVREGGAGVIRPVLGGGATGALVGWSPDPLARRPFTVFARAYAPHLDASTPDQEALTAAIGVSWRPLPGVPLAVTAERLFAAGAYGRDAWSARVGGGSERALPWSLTLTGYGETGVVGRRPDWFAGGQLGLERRFDLPLGFSAAPGLQLWASGEHARDTVWRTDVGPMLRIGHTRWPTSVSLDYRWRVGGNAEPASGPAVTIYGRF